MTEDKKNILVLEPYYGGSHKSFLHGLQAHLPFDFTLVTLPSRKWKMRMQLAAPWMAERVIKLVQAGNSFDAILCSTFIDAATLRTMLYKEGIKLPLVIYFHENQFAYPNQIKDAGIYQFTALNFTSALAADRIAFNSRYNYETFFHGVHAYLKKAADMEVRYLEDGLREKSIVLHPGIEINQPAPDLKTVQYDVPVIVWNHRWEHDKDPETFFHALDALSKLGVDYKVIVLGQHFERCPTVFAQAAEKLKEHIIHIGFVEDRKEYLKLLIQSDIVVSTARHEFFGLAVLEAVSCGCYPLVPNRLSYKELFPSSFRYPEGKFQDSLHKLLENFVPLSKQDVDSLITPYYWSSLVDDYVRWFSSLPES